MDLRAKKLFKYVSPGILGSISYFLYTIIDGIFVGRGVGGNALGAVNLAFPYVMLFMALCQMATVGGMTITAIRMGRADNKGANQAFIHSFLMTVAISVVMMLVGLLLTEQLSRLLGAGDGFLKLTSEYIWWCCIFFIPEGLGMNLMGFVRNDGAPVLVSAATIIGTVMNIIGDYIAIFPLNMGLKGAALATGISQTVTMLICLIHFIRHDGILRFKPVKYDRTLAGKILVRGTPECVSQFSVPISTVLTNNVLISTLGDMAVNAYSVLCYAASFTVSVFVGTAEGIQPLFGNSYGEENEKDLKYYFRAGLYISGIGSLLLSVMIAVGWGGICRMFAVDAETAACSTYALPGYLGGFVVQAFTVIITSYLYSTTRTKQALIINVLRSFIVNTLVIILLPMVFGPDAIWWTFLVFESIVLASAVIIVKAADLRGAIGSTKE